MNPMIEAGARATCRAFLAKIVHPDGLDNAVERDWPNYTDVFRAAVRAMMETLVSEAMSNAWLACYGNYVHSDGDLRTQANDTWRAMCAAVLEGE